MAIEGTFDPNAAIRSGRDWVPDDFVSTPEMIWRP